MNKFKGAFRIRMAQDRIHWYWTLQADNEEVLCDCQMLKSKQAARVGIRSVKRIALFAAIIDMTADDV